MVSGFSNEQLEQAGLSSPAQRCFVQRWLELFHPRTMDSYAVKVMNAHGALNELRDVIMATITTQMDPGHLSSVWAEARDKVKEDVALKTRATFLRNAILHLLTNEPKAKEHGKLKHVLNELEGLLQVVDDKYIDWNVATLDDAFRKGDQTAATRVAENLASEFLRSRDTHSLYDLGLLLCKGNFDAQWRAFTAVLRGKPNTFIVYVPVEIRNLDALRQTRVQAGLSVVDRTEIINRAPQRGHDLRRHYAVLTVDAHDYRTAVKKAMAYVDQQLGVVSFFLGPSGRVPDGTAFVQYGDPPKFRSVKPEADRQQSENLDKLEWALEVLASTDVEPVSKSRPMDAMQYASVARRAHSPTSRFLGYWVALETLVRQAGPVTAAVNSYVAPILCNEYIYRLVRNFLDDCKRCQADLSPVLGCPQDDYYTATRACLVAVCDRDRKEALIQRCAHHDGLALRATQLAECLADGKSVWSLVQGHRQRLEWHLYRLYRIRNDIVHAGKAPELLEPCLPHLEDYVYRVTTTLLYLMRKHQLKSISAALSLARYNLIATLEYLHGADRYDPRIALAGALL